MGKLREWLFGGKEKPVEKFAELDVSLTVQERATLARQALKNSVFASAFNDLAIEAGMLWQKTATHEVREREMLWRHVRALRQLKGRLEKYISDALIDEKRENSRKQ